ncbi:MAG: RHS repeat protein [Lachnospiraceae bacterium]|nr:RHS repeat protein [Lachnospiraceae bacterium]
MFQNKQTNWRKRILAAALTAILCLTAVSFSAFAVPEDTSGEEEDHSGGWTELTDRREIASRTFVSGSGGEVTALYPYPIFYQNEEGGLTPYDYRLELVSGEEDAKEYQVRDGSMDTRVRRFFDGGEFMTFDFAGNGKTMALCLPATGRGRTKVPEFKVQAGLYKGEPAGQNGSAQGSVAAEYIRSYGLCEGALTGIDIGVEQWPGNAEISVVFQKVSRAKEGLTLSAVFDGLTMKEAGDGSLHFSAGGEEVAVLEAPVVYDEKRAEGKASYLLSSREDGATQILVKPDEEWMKGLSRTGPITIRMRVTKTGMEEGIAAEIQSTEGYDNGVPVAVGNTRETVQTEITLPDLPALSEGKNLERVSLVLGRAEDAGEVQGSLELGVYKKGETEEAKDILMDSVKYETDDKADVCMLDVTEVYEDPSSQERKVFLKSVQTELVTGIYGFDFFAADKLLPMLLVSSTGTEEEQQEESLAIGEDTWKRDQFTKHFLMDDGSFAAAVYEIPVHYKKNGVWEEIDNTLVWNEEEDIYENRASDVEVKFSKDAAAESLVAMESEGSGFSWGFLEAETGEEKSSFKPEKGIEAKAASGEERYLELSGEREGKSIRAYNADLMKQTGLTSGGTYADVLESVDIRYVFDSAELKESIVFQSREAAETPIRFLISHPGLKMSLEADGSAVLTRAGTVVWRFTAPYMYDWAGESSRAVRFRLEEESKEATILTVEPDREWLLKKQRTYPVAIERTVEPTGRSAIQTAFVREKQPEEKAEEAAPLAMGYLSGYGVSRILLKFTHLPELEYGDRLTKGLLNLYQTQYVSKRTADFLAAVYKVSEEWDETVTWDSQPAREEEAVDSQTAEGPKIGGTQGLLSLKQFDITSLAENWYKGENWGLMAASSEENVKAGAGYTASNRSTRSEMYPSLLYPTGLFYYQKEKGLLESQNVRKQEAGQAGTGYVSDSGENMIFVHEDLSGEDGRFSEGVSHRYVSGKGRGDSVFGNSWSLNVAEKLEATGLSGLPYVYRDENGTEHFFPSDETEESKKQAVGSPGLTLTEEGGQRVLSREDGSERIFGPDGLLLQKKEADGAEISYQYDGGGRLVSLSDERGVLVSFTYGEDGKKLLSLTDKRTEKTLSYQYDSLGNLKAILHPDGKAVSYYYEEGCLIQAKDTEGREVEYIYETEDGRKRICTTKERNGNQVKTKTY